MQPREPVVRNRVSANQVINRGFAEIENAAGGWATVMALSIASNFSGMEILFLG